MIAQTILESIQGASAVTLSGGYAMLPNGKRALFDACVVISEKRNASGRCTFMQAGYSDGSGIVFSWNDRDGARFTLAQGNKSLAYLAHCEAREQSAQDNATREFWHRLSGNVRKAATM